MYQGVQKRAKTAKFESNAEKGGICMIERIGDIIQNIEEKEVKEHISVVSQPIYTYIYNKLNGKSTLFSFYIHSKNHKLLKLAAKYSKKSMGAVLNALIQQKLQNPIIALTERKKELAKEMNSIDEQIAYLEENYGIDTNNSRKV